jgi:hypothetical protein
VSASSWCQKLSRYVRQPPSAPSSTAALWVFLLFFYLFCICVVIYLYFCLFFVGFYLPAVIWFNLEEEIAAGGCPSASLWFFVVLAVQQSFHNGGCFTRIGLFMEFLCILHRLVRP